MEWWNKSKERLRALVDEYGPVALVVYFTIFFATWFSFWMAIESGADVAGAEAGAGTVVAAWGATKLTQPVRIAATLVITPILAALRHRWRPPTEGSPQGPTGEG